MKRATEEIWFKKIVQKKLMINVIPTSIVQTHLPEKPHSGKWKMQLERPNVILRY